MILGKDRGARVQFRFLLMRFKSRLHCCPVIKGALSKRSKFDRRLCIFLFQPTMLSAAAY